MARGLAVASASTELYRWRDKRGEGPLLAFKQQYDLNPEATATIARARTRLCMELEPNWYPGCGSTTLLELRRDPVAADLVHKSLGFKVALPRWLAHHDIAKDFAEDGTYIVVSTAWRDAIESLEPDVHEFFPVELCFANGIANDRFVFRERQFLADGARTAVGVKRQAIAGRHWLRYDQDRFVSRELAALLRPLLPRDTDFFQITLTDAA